MRLLNALGAAINHTSRDVDDSNPESSTMTQVEQAPKKNKKEKKMSKREAKKRRTPSETQELRSDSQFHPASSRLYARWSTSTSQNPAAAPPNRPVSRTPSSAPKMILFRKCMVACIASF